MNARVLLGGLLLSLLVPLCAFGQQGAPGANPLVGTWKLVSSTRDAIPSGEKMDVFGPHPMGYISYSQDGRMMVLIVRSDRKAPREARATAAEGAALFRSMIAYGGTYTLQGDRVVHDVDISWNESRTRTQQTRIMKLEGKRLLRTTPPSRDPVDGTYSTRTIVWEKIGD